MLWSWHDGEHYWGGWVGFIVLLLPTFVSNAVTFLLITYSPRLNRSSSSLMVRYLAVEDGAFSLLCLLQCAINLGHMEIYGERAGCEIQAVYALFFMLATGYTLCCIAYNSEQKISFKPGLSQRQVFYIHLGIWVLSFVIALASSYLVADARIMPSSTYCLVSLVSLEAGLIFYIPGVAFIGAFLTHRYYLIYKHITTQASSLVASFAQQKQASQQRQIKVAKRMFVIVCAYFVCALPVVVISIYECIVGEDAPASVHIVGGHMVHVNSLLNPILYVWMNSATRAALWEFLGFKGGSKPLLQQADGDGQPLVAMTPMGENVLKMEDKAVGDLAGENANAVALAVLSVAVPSSVQSPGKMKRVSTSNSVFTPQRGSIVLDSPNPFSEEIMRASLAGGCNLAMARMMSFVPSSAGLAWSPVTSHSDRLHQQLSTTVNTADATSNNSIQTPGLMLELPQSINGSTRASLLSDADMALLQPSPNSSNPRPLSPFTQQGLALPEPSPLSVQPRPVTPVSSRPISLPHQITDEGVE